MSFAVRAEMAVSVLPENVVPAGATGVGVGMIVQAEPSQCSASARFPSLRPTAQALPPPRFATPNRIDFAPPVVAGVGTMVQLVPSQCAASGSVWANPVRLIEPTAQTSFAAAAETAFSFSSDPMTLGVVTWDHAVPSQCSASMTWPSSSFGPRKLPTAQASVLVRAATALNWLENATFCGDGFTVGVITHAGAAKAGPAKAMAAAPTAGSTTVVRTAMRRARRPARFRWSSRAMVFIAEIPFQRHCAVPCRRFAQHGQRAWYGTEIRLKRAAGALSLAGYWIPARTDVMRWVLKPSQCIRPT